jgi:hypothetical protein
MRWEVPDSATIYLPQRPNPLEGKGCAEGTNGNGIVVFVVIRVENHNDSRCNTNVVSDPDAIEAFKMKGCIGLPPWTCGKVALDEVGKISACGKVTTGNLRRLTDVNSS